MQTLDSLAVQVLTLAKSRLMVDLRFLSAAFDRLAPVSDETLPTMMSTDGRTLHYQPLALLTGFQSQHTLPAHVLLHTTLHCLLGHPFQRQAVDSVLWDIACDIAVEEVIFQLDLPACALAEDGERQTLRLIFTENCPHMTAEEIYRYLLQRQPGSEELADFMHAFAHDSHALWHTHFAQHNARHAAGTSANAPDIDETPVEDTVPAPLQLDETAQHRARRQNSQLQREWKQLAQQVETDLKLFSKRYGRRAGALMENLAPITFEECDYSEFLRRFGVQNEVMQLSDDEFDLIYYTYGLKTYGNVPLVEPLEYRDDKRIREFVIAIDTSGSVQGEIVQSFLQRTCDVLRQSGSFTQRVNIYLIQCDAEVQSVEQLTDLEQLSSLIPRLRLRGFGGTDFRPVFDYVDTLLAERKLTNLGGLLYFTDGAGTYPERAPAYKTAFIFNRDDHISPQVPAWAIRAVLTTDNIRMLKEGA